MRMRDTQTITTNTSRHILVIQIHKELIQREIAKFNCEKHLIQSVECDKKLSDEFLTI